MKYNDLQSKILTEFTGILFSDLKASYKPAADHLDKLYFATDTHELLVNGTSYSGGVSISCGGVWDIRKDYDKLCLVTDGSYNYISRKQVPNGTDITNEEYWQKLYSVISTNGFYRIPGNIEDININTNPEGLEIVLGNYLDLKRAVLSNNIILTKTSILNVIIAGIDGLSVVIEYMYFGEDKISKYQYFLRVDEYYKWKQVSSIQEQVFLKVDVVLDDTSNNAVANKAVTSIIKKIINWH